MQRGVCAWVPASEVHFSVFIQVPVAQVLQLVFTYLRRQVQTVYVGVYVCVCVCRRHILEFFALKEGTQIVSLCMPNSNSTRAHIFKYLSLKIFVRVYVCVNQVFTLMHFYHSNSFCSMY